MKLLFFLLVLLFSVQTVMAQKKYMDANLTYNNAKIYQKGKSEVLRVTNLKVKNDSLVQFQELVNGNKITDQLPNTDIRYISVKSGNYAGTYAVYGGAIGLLSSLIAVLENEPYGNSGFYWTPFILGFTGGGAIIGGLVGVLSPRWKTLYVPKQLSTYNIDFTPNVNKYYCGLGVKITF